MCIKRWLTVLCACVIVLQRRTPTILAAYWGHTDALKVLIEADADIEAKDIYVGPCWCVVCVGQGG